jgi:hypothetical protein
MHWCFQECRAIGGQLAGTAKTARGQQNKRDSYTNLQRIESVETSRTTALRATS